MFKVGDNIIYKSQQKIISHVYKMLEYGETYAVCF